MSSPIRLVAIDLDGTLLDDSKRVTERTVEACGFAIEDEGRRAKGDMRRFAARPAPASRVQ